MFSKPVSVAVLVHVFLLLLFQAVDLLKRFLVYHSKERISAAEVSTCTKESNSFTEDCRRFGFVVFQNKPDVKSGKRVPFRL